jgi:hypothetical protein
MKRRNFALVMAALMMTLAPVLSESSYAQCVRSSNTKILPVNATSALLYWYETCTDNSSTVFYQRSVDGLNTWTAPRQLFHLADGRSAIQSFEGIIVGGNTLLSALAIERGGLPVAIYVRTSTNRGGTWSPVTLVRSFNGTFAGCPVLDTSYETRLGLFIIRTVIQAGNSTHVYLLKSPDGINWTSSRLGGSNFPSTCDDDG